MGGVNRAVFAVAGQNIDKGASDHGVGRVEAVLFYVRHSALCKDDSKGITISEAKHLHGTLKQGRAKKRSTRHGPRVTWLL